MRTNITFTIKNKVSSIKSQLTATISRSDNVRVVSIKLFITAISLLYVMGRWRYYLEAFVRSYQASCESSSGRTVRWCESLPSSYRYYKEDTVSDFTFGRRAARKAVDLEKLSGELDGKKRLFIMQLLPMKISLRVIKIMKKE